MTETNTDIQNVPIKSNIRSMRDLVLLVFLYVRQTWTLAALFDTEESVSRSRHIMEKSSDHISNQEVRSKIKRGQ